MCVGLAGALLGAARARALDPAPRPDVAQQPDATVANAPPTISLRALLAAAEHNLPSVLTALATLRRVAAEQHAAEGAWLPRATGEATLGLLYDNRPVLPGSTAASDATRIDSLNLLVAGTATVDWAAYDASRKHTVEAASASTRREKWEVEARKRVALMAAAELYLRALSASALVEDAGLNLARRTQQEESIAELARAGVRPPVDATRAHVETLAATYVLETRQVDEQASFAALAAAIGQSPERGLRPEPLAEDPFAGPAELAQASQLARDTRPELKRLREQIAAAKASQRATWSGRLPSAGVLASGQVAYSDVFESVSDGEGLEGAQGNVRGALYVRWAGADAQLLRRQKIALARIEEAERELESTELSIRAEVVDASYAVRRTRAQLEQATQVLEAARATRAAQQERYGAGVASLLELLDAEALEQGARRARIEAGRDYDLARAKLLAVCGTLHKLIAAR